MSWHTVMDAVTFWGQAFIEDPDRVGTTKALGVDETRFLSATATEATRWVASICDVERRSVVDVIEGRQAPELGEWLNKAPPEWKDGVTTTVWGVHEPFRAALAAYLPDATAVADPFPVVAVGTRCVDKTRRRERSIAPGTSVTWARSLAWASWRRSPGRP